MERPARALLMQELREKIQRLEGSQPGSARQLIFSTGLEELDRLFPEGGLAAGSLTEWLSYEEGCGEATLALVLAGRVQAHGGVMVVIDDQGEFYPPAMQALGMSLQHTIVIRPRQARDSLWAWEQVLRSAAVAAAVGWLGKLNDRVFRRLQLAAEAGGTVGFLLRPASCRREPSWAQARFLVEALASEGSLASLSRRLRVEVLYCRGGSSQSSAELELCDEEDVVRLVSSVADPTLSPRAARA